MSDYKLHNQIEDALLELDAEKAGPLGLIEYWRRYDIDPFEMADAIQQVAENGDCAYNDVMFGVLLGFSLRARQLQLST